MAWTKTNRDMTRLFLCSWLLYVLQVSDADFNASRDSCIPALPPVSSKQMHELCLPYQYKRRGYCRNVLGDVLVKIGAEDQRLLERDLSRIDVTIRAILLAYNFKPSKDCVSVFNDVYCRWALPKCDTNTANLTAQTICKESCQYFYKMCQREMELVTPLIEQSQRLNCSVMVPTNGGESPECYHTRYLNTETDKLRATECYYGNGLGYRGNASVTRSGHVCQSWSSQCPHRHDHPLSEYPELVNASNWCRNPGGQGPNGPWCYTTNSSVRWEYCGVEKCPPPVPSQAPTILQVSTRGPNKVYFAWRPVPLPFLHGQLRGVRILVKKLDVHRHERHTVNITNPSTTSTELTDLQPLTNYSLSVLAFNENGDGPSSRAVSVETMPETQTFYCVIRIEDNDFISVQFVLTLNQQTFSQDLLDKQSTRYQKLASRVTRTVSSILEKTKKPGYRIYHIEISRFLNGSVLVELYLTAEVLGFLPKWSIVQDITGRMVQRSAGPKSRSGKLDFSLLVVKTFPPPPANVSHSGVTTTSAKVYWSPPLYHEPYRIKNYTVQYKKANTKMSYYAAVISNKTKVTVDNLDVDTKYLMRVVSVNAYGSTASQPITIKTKGKSTANNTALIIALSVSAAVIGVASIIIVVAWRRWSNKREYLAQTNPFHPTKLYETLGIEITKDWLEIPRDNLLIEDQLGSGSFGVVMRAYLKSEGNNKILCAVKMLQDNPTERELRDLCNEINLMTVVGDHPNIISLIGACTIDGPPWLVVKYAVNGSLLNYLVENRETSIYSNLENLDNRVAIPPRTKLGFAYDIAKGMSHLEKNRVVHRDLAARNILLGRNMVAMVSDFGLSRDVYQMGVYENTRGGVLPVRWMSLESLENYTYTTESDVWSYGVVLWEIENGGKMPYAGIDNGQQILEYLKQGYRLENQENTSRYMEAIMQECWNLEPKRRPTFSSLVDKISELLQRREQERRDPDDGYLPDNQDHLNLGNNTGYHDNEEIELTEYARGGDMEGRLHDNAGYEDDEDDADYSHDDASSGNKATSTPAKAVVTMTTSNNTSQYYV